MVATVLLLYSVCVQLFAWYVSMSLRGDSCANWFLYGLRVFMFRAIQPVPGLVASALLMCLWYWMEMYSVMSLSIGIPLCVKMIVCCISGVFMCSFDGVYRGVVLLFGFIGMSVVWSAQWFACAMA